MQSSLWDSKVFKLPVILISLKSLFWCDWGVAWSYVVVSSDDPASHHATQEAIMRPTWKKNFEPYFLHFDLYTSFVHIFVLYLYELCIGYCFSEMCYNFSLFGVTFLFYPLGNHFRHLLHELIGLRRDFPCLFQECLNPIVDASSGRNLIPAMLYMGQKLRLNHFFVSFFLYLFFFCLN